KKQQRKYYLKTEALKFMLGSGTRTRIFYIHLTTILIRTLPGQRTLSFFARSQRKLGGSFLCLHLAAPNLGLAYFHSENLRPRTESWPLPKQKPDINVGHLFW